MGPVAQDSKIFGHMLFARTAVVFTEADFRAPVYIVFGKPVVSNGSGDSGSMALKAGDEISRFGTNRFVKQGSVKEDWRCRASESGSEEGESGAGVRAH